MKRLAFLMTIVWLSGISSIALAQNVCQRAATHNLSCWRAFCGENPHSPVCTDTTRQQMEAAVTSAATSCGSSAEQAQSERLLGRSCADITTVWPTGPSPCEVAANQINECARAFCSNHPHSIMCSAETLTALAPPIAACSGQDREQANAISAQSCEQISREWPIHSVCDQALEHLNTCLDAFCAAHTASPACTPEGRAAFNPPEGPCTGEIAETASLILSVSCEQLAAELPTQSFCAQANAHLAGCAESFCQLHPESIACAEEALAARLLVEEPCTGDSELAAQALMAMTCDRITSEWPTQSLCDQALAHLNTCLDAFCAAHSASPVCTAEGRAAFNPPEGPCAAEIAEVANFLLASSCEVLSADLPTQSVCAQANAHLAGCAEAFCQAHPESVACSQEALVALVLIEDPCTGETEQAAQVLVETTCDQITSAWPTQSLCDQAVAHLNVCLDAFCQAHPTSPTCTPEGRAALHPPDGPCAGEIEAVANLVLASSCEDISADWPTQPVCEQAAIHLNACADAFCAAHTASPMCTPEGRAALLPPPGQCAGDIESMARRFLSQTCEQLTGAWPTGE